MANTERNSLGGRLARYARVGTAVGGLAARFAGERVLGMTLERDKHAAELRVALGGLKGPLMKVAQLLSTIPDALPQEYVAELQQLQSDAPAMGWPFVKRRMAAELGPAWHKRFRGFEQTAAAAASLGQVHRAEGPDGRRLACKLQYPDMASAVEADLRQLALIFAIFERYDSAISTRQIQAEIAARLREELDYEREAKHARLYRAMLADTAGVHVPDVVGDLSTRRLLTMEWVDGRRILDFVAEHPDARNDLAMNMFRAWYVPFYAYGVIHGDPHLGNYTVRPDRSINLLDFGCIRVFRPSFVKGVTDLYNALRTGDDELAVESYRIWGFANPTKELVDVLNIWARFVYAPLMEDRDRRIQDSDTGLYGRETAEKVHAELRRVGGVEIPREFVFMDRAAIGLGSVFLHLKAEVNWYRLFQELIAGFDVDALAARQATALEAQGLPLPE
ncbi:AarF/ABC1/UbiB kinase family protein [Azospirillum sp. RWY-5-1]|uniref:AarF/ABC1/UbiB kinase family protein n=1 Tax=Azospirillum oleiclasticum TaxID=2735135 RepID=A0ABX2THD6_9PROT|nr:AarF/UbiB family protein [Azospirillum oleiclasticum]NYZ16182.1 AarF/ABC1/UbiB kinase family protein [Azospirillum oleiclasticum]NYZ23668.1 AarF/ABC1/UbiB kinase family protein [Azospirillum oleiclasticum]